MKTDNTDLRKRTAMLTNRCNILKSLIPDQKSTEHEDEKFDTKIEMRNIESEIRIENYKNKKPLESITAVIRTEEKERGGVSKVWG